MEPESIKQMAMHVVDVFLDFYKDCIDDMVIYDVVENQDNGSFAMKFILYNYFGLNLIYSYGRIKISIIDGRTGIELPISCDIVDDTSLTNFCIQVDEEIRLRIPDKYLEKYGWLGR